MYRMVTSRLLLLHGRRSYLVVLTITSTILYSLCFLHAVEASFLSYRRNQPSCHNKQEHNIWISTPTISIKEKIILLSHQHDHNHQTLKRRISNDILTRSRRTEGDRMQLPKLQMSTNGDDNGLQENNSSGVDADSSMRIPPVVTLGVGLLIVIVSFLLHLDSWNHLFSSIMEMKVNAESSEEFSSSIQFWLFGVLIHPILQPIFWISEVLHASPGPKILDLVPISFLIGSGTILYTTLFILPNEIRQLLSVVILATLVNYIGLGLDGQTSNMLGDYNIQFDDTYQGQIIKGCPTSSSDIQLNTVRNFDYTKYEGKWYWHKVHDWTQFKEIYDTTLDITLNDDKTGYTNTLTIKGPSPKTSPLSWDKSPLQYGARYSWTGQIIDDNNNDIIDDDNKKDNKYDNHDDNKNKMGDISGNKNSISSHPGVSLESGFGVTFPNYIVDVQLDTNNENYKELIQFQCIEVGGVRIYEGIDFMSRSPQMSDKELENMHQRAHEAGLDPYGSSPDQMHRIERQEPQAAETAKNSWQKMWEQIGVQKLLDNTV